MLLKGLKESTYYAFRQIFLEYFWINLVRAYVLICFDQKVKLITRLAHMAPKIDLILQFDILNASVKKGFTNLKAKLQVVSSTQTHFTESNVSGSKAIL